MKTKQTISRRAVLKSFGALGAVLVAADSTKVQAAESTTPLARKPARVGDARKIILEHVFKAPLIDTHEHLIEEKQRLDVTSSSHVPCDDWALLLSHYLNSDLLVAGMPKADMDQFLSPKVEPGAKWKLIAPYWRAVKNTGYAQAVRIACRELYAVDDVSAATVAKIQAGYEKTRRTGFYHHILHDLAGIQSCQVNCLTGVPFKESDMPTFLMQDISIVGMFAGPNIRQYAPATGIDPKTLSDWHRVIDWWFDRYGKYAVAAKSQNAYSRDIDYARVPAEKAEPVFAKVLQKDPVNPEDRKLLEDHLFWYAVEQATRHGLPVKLHTGYYAGQNSMPLARLQHNPGSASDLCRLSPDTKFVFMHIGYPYYEEMLALAKNYANAHIDMCWSWIINPVAAKDYLKKHIVTAPANKLLPFGGDYIPVEPVLGHAIIARRGISQALFELVDEGWLTLTDALELVDIVLHGNARQIFHLTQKTEALKTAEWVK
ncbi:MAG: amidohydrolase family protein [Verrucomicrobiota bacterium]